MIMKIVYTETKDMEMGIDFVELTAFNASQDNEYAITDEDQDPYYEIVVKNEKGELVKEITKHTYSEATSKNYSTDYKFDKVEMYTDKMVLIAAFE